MEEVEVKILADNLVYESGMLAEHGLSFWINYRGDKFLFDTGEGMILENNAEKMEIDLSDISGVILSHGHHDHGGGIEVLKEINEEVKLYAHPRVFMQKFVHHREEDYLEEVGLKFSREDVDFRPVTSPQKIAEDLTLTGEIPRNNDWEKTPDKYKTSSAEKGKKSLEKDDFRDDQALFFPTSKGVVVLLGCAHAGVVNTIEYIRSIIDQNKIRAVMGGMHLYNAEEVVVKKTIDYLKKLDPELIVPMHCTGISVEEKIKQALGSRAEIGEVGKTFLF